MVDYKNLCTTQLVVIGGHATIKSSGPFNPDAELFVQDNKLYKKTVATYIGKLEFFTVIHVGHGNLTLRDIMVIVNIVRQEAHICVYKNVYNILLIGLRALVSNFFRKFRADLLC